MKLSSSQRKYIKRKTKHHTPTPDELDDELNIIPFLDIVVNLIMFLLMSISSIAFFAQIELVTPTYASGGVGSRGAEEPLNLSVTIVPEGIIVAGAQGKLSPGCRTTQTGRVITVPRVKNSYDWAALNECARLIKEQYEDEEQVTVSADPVIAYKHVVRAIDSMRGDVKDVNNEYFPKPRLSAGLK